MQKILSSPTYSRKNKLMGEFKVPIFVTGCSENVAR